MRKRLLGPLMALLLAFGAMTPAAIVVAAPATMELATTPGVLAMAIVPVTQAPDLQLVQATELVLPVQSWNPADWFKDAAILGAVIAAVVALLKANFLKNLDGLATLAVSFGLGIGISLLGTINLPVIGRSNELDGVAAIMFGINAAVFASGGWDFIKGVIMAAFGGKSRGATEAST